jgi:hypothetical protein
MASPEKVKQRLLTEQRLKKRLQRAASRVEAAEQERIWAVVTAHLEGLSIRKIAQVTGLSSSRVHQLLHTDGTRQLAQAVNALLTAGQSIEEPSPNLEPLDLETVQQQLFEEGEVLGWCIEWLEQLRRGEQVVVNLRSPSDSRAACVSFDQSRVIRVLKRIAGTLDELSGRRITDETLDSEVDPVKAGVKHRQRLAEPEPQLSSLSQRAQREILREQLGLMPRYYDD